MTTNAAAQPGDRLVLTKRIGTGVIATAIKRELASAEVAEGAIASMTGMVSVLKLMRSPRGSTAGGQGDQAFGGLAASPSLSCDRQIAGGVFGPQIICAEGGDGHRRNP